jgi:hypothetical protein
MAGPDPRQVAPVEVAGEADDLRHIDNVYGVPVIPATTIWHCPEVDV